MGEYRKSGNFDRNKRSGGRGNSGGRSDFRKGGRDSGRTEMFKAVCDSCRKDCEIPFKPNSDRPVYCSDCFRTSKDDGYSDRGGRDGGSKSSQQRAPQNSGAFTPAKTQKTNDKQLKEIAYHLGALNDKLEQIIGLMGGNESEKEETLKSVVDKVVASTKKGKKKVSKKVAKKSVKKASKKVAKKKTTKKK